MCFESFCFKSIGLAILMEEIYIYINWAAIFDHYNETRIPFAND